MLQSVLFLTGHSSLFFFSLNQLIREIPPKMMAVLQLSAFREWLSCSYSSLCPENAQATAVQQQEKRGTQNHWRMFCYSPSHFQCLGFGFSARESALWRGMPWFNKSLTISQCVVATVADILWEIRSREGLLSGNIQAAVLGLTVSPWQIL